HLQPTSQGASVELNRPRPVRRLSASVIATPEPAPTPAPSGPSSNGHGQHASAFVSAPRRVERSVFAIDRMQIDGLSVFYGSKEAVKSVSLPVRQGEVLALIGPSGCGKTTLLRSLNRLTELTRGASLQGRITLDGVDITTIEPTLLRRRVTMVFQQPNPFPMSVFDNIAYVLREQARRR